MFSLSWFATIPGILITVGVLLLIIALVIFIVTNKKSKMEDKKKEEPLVPLNPAPEPSIIPIKQNYNDTSLNNQMPTIQVPNNIDNGMNSNVTMPSAVDMSIPASPYVNSAPSMTSVMPSINASPSEGVAVTSNVVDNNMMSYQNAPINSNMSMNTSPVMETSPTITTLESNNNLNVQSPYSAVSTVEAVPSPSAPVLNINEPVPNIVANEIPTITTPEIASAPSINVETPSQDSFVNNNISVPTVEQVLPEMQVQQMPSFESPVAPSSNVSSSVVSTPINQTPIYGGVTTIIPDTTPEVTPQIYGGANPLESTQQVPISQIANDINNANNSANMGFDMNSNVSSPVMQAPEIPALTITPNVPQTSTDGLSGMYQANNAYANTPYSATAPNTVQPNVQPQMPFQSNVAYQGVSNQQPMQVPNYNQNIQ